MAITNKYNNVIPNALNNTGVSSVLPNTSMLAGSSTTGLPVQDTATAELQQQIQSLEKSTSTQEARVMAAAGPDVLNQYKQENEEKKEGLITKFLNLLDTPRNTIFVGFKEASESGDFLGGLAKGFTREEVYSGYDLAYDMGFDGPAKAVVGFAAEMTLDPLNYFSAGLSSVTKGFAQGAVKDAVQEVGEQYVKSSVRELASDAVQDGAEKVANTIVDSGIKGAENRVAEEVAQRAVKTAQTVSNSSDAIGGVKGVVNNVSKVLDEVENTYGITYGPAKKQALFYQAKKVITNIGSLGNGLTDDALELASKGNYGEELKAMADEFTSIRNSLATSSVDEASQTIMKDRLKELRTDLLNGLRDHKVDLKLDSFRLHNIDADAINTATNDLYAQTIEGALNQMKQEFKVADADGLKQVLSGNLGREATDADLLYELIQRGFGPQVTGQITTNMKYNVKAMSDTVKATLMDYTGSMNYYDSLLKEYGKQVGRAMQFEIPFTNISKKIADAEQLYELGAKARTAISYRVTANGVERTTVGAGLDKVDDVVKKLFGRIPILEGAFDGGKAWALKIIQNDARFSKNVATAKAEANLGEMFTTLKNAGYSTKEQIEDVGRFVSSAIESNSLPKDFNLDSWRAVIDNFDQLDDKTIASTVKDRMSQLVEELKQDPVRADEILRYNDDGTIDETYGAFKEWYRNTENGLRRSLELQSNAKEIFYNYNEKQQNAMLEITNRIASDFNNIGKELAEKGLIPDDRILQAEYWYYPHQISLDLQMNRVDDLTGKIKPKYTQVLPGIKENLTIKDAATWQRKYPMSAQALNEILEKKYGIKNMLETNAFNTYLLYAIQQNKVLADANSVNELLNEFGIRCLNADTAKALRAQGYEIVVERSNINAFVVNEQTAQYMKQGINKNIDAVNEKVKVINRFNKQVSDLSQKTSDVLKNSIEYTAELKDAKTKLKEAQKGLRSLLKDANVELPDGIDDETFYEIAESALNDSFLKGNGDNVYRTMTMGNVEFPEKNIINVLKDENGVPYTAIGNMDNINGGYRIVPEAPNVYKDGETSVHVFAKNPAQMNITSEQSMDIQGFLNSIPEAEMSRMKAAGNDAILATTEDGARIIIPFDDNQVYDTNRFKESLNSGKRYAAFKANTIDGGFLAVEPSQVFKADDEVIKVSDLTFKQRGELKKLIDNDYQRIEGANKERSKRLTQLNNEATKLQEQLASLDTDLQSLDPIRDADKITKINLEIREKDHTLTRCNTEFFKLQNQINSSESSEEYKFLATLSGKAGYKNASLTRAQLAGMLGSSRNTGLQILGYEAIDAGIDEATGKQLYEQLDNAKYYASKKDLKDWYDDKLLKIKQNQTLSDILSILADDGSGEDPLAAIVQRLSNKGVINAQEAYLNKLKKIVETSGVTVDTVNEAGETVSKTIPRIKNLTDRQTHLIASMLSGNGYLYSLNKSEAVDDLFALASGAVGISKTDSRVFAIPPEIYKNFNKAYAKKTDEGLREIRQLMYRFNKIWKPSVTSWRPSFAVRNLMSGYFNSFMELGGHVFDPDVTDAAYKIATGKDLDTVVKFGDVEMTLRELKDEMIKRGATNTFTATDITTLDQALGDQIRKALDPSFSNKIKHPLRTLEQFSEATENYNRSLAFIASVKSGHGLDTAGEIVRKTQFDYTDLTEFEKGVKKVFPFYTWLRDNLEFQIEKFLDNPALYMALMRRLPEFTKELSGMSDEEYDNMPDWVKESFPLTVGYDKATGRYRLFDTTLPYQDLANIGGFETTMDTVVGLLHPAIKTPLELWLNKNLYTGAALQSYEGETAEKAIQGSANPILNALGKISPNTLRNNPGLTNAANQVLNTFGLAKDIKYLSNTQGTSKTGTIYSSKDVSHTNSSLVNLVENALFDTNQLKYYSADSGYKDQLYQKSRDLSNLIQKLSDQGYEVPDSSSVSKLAKQVTSMNSKGSAMARAGVGARGSSNISLSTAVANSLQYYGYTGIEGGVSGSIIQGKSTTNGGVSGAMLKGNTRGSDKVVTFGNGTYIDENGNEVSKDDIYKGTWGKETMRADDGTMYREFTTTSGDVFYLNPQEINLVAWQESNTFEEEVEEYKKAYEEYKSLPNDKKPDTWYSLYINDSHYELPIYNQMVATNFDSKKLKAWFIKNPNYIAWKQTSVPK